MQAQEIGQYEMTRDMDLIRELVLQIEADPIFDGRHWITFDASEEIRSKHSMDEIYYHIQLLIEADVVRGNLGPVHPTISRLTWKGHEFADDIKDDDIWSKIKERLLGLPSVAISVLAEVAKAEVKKKLGLPN